MGERGVFRDLVNLGRDSKHRYLVTARRGSVAEVVVVVAVGAGVVMAVVMVVGGSSECGRELQTRDATRVWPVLGRGIEGREVGPSPPTWPSPSPPRPRSRYAITPLHPTTVAPAPSHRAPYAPAPSSR